MAEVIYLTTRRTVFRSDDRKKPKGMIDLYQGDNGMTGIDACVPTDIAARMLLVAKKAGIKVVGEIRKT